MSMNDAKPLAEPQPWLELQVLVDRDGHWTLRKLAAGTDYTAEYVRLLLAGKTRVTAKAIRRFADLLKVPYSVLVPGPRDHDVPEQRVDADIAEGGVAA
jgi:transcriptional regulator with XRE-family HTH domain